MPLLELQDMTVAYGRIEAVRGISITVDEGELVTLIGANGAGKTTTMRAISGIRPVARGKVLFDGKDITKMKAHLRVLEGIVQAPEGRGIFPGMTVVENLEMGAYARTFASKAEHDETVERVFDLFRGSRSARSRWAAPCRAASSRCSRSGARSWPGRASCSSTSRRWASPMVIQQIFRIVSEINAQGTTVLLVEQNAQQALSRSHRAYVLETGEVVRSGGGRELLADSSIKEAYLGVA